MPIRSHVDLVLFARFIYVSSDCITDAAVEAIEKAKDPADAFKAWRAQYATHAGLLLHENYHFWQGLRLPFLHWYANGCLSDIFSIFRELSTEFPRLWDWSAISPDHELVNLRWHCWHVANSDFQMSISEADGPSAYSSHSELSILDLLEAPASVTQWQVSTAIEHGMESACDPRMFRRWTKRNPAYLAAYEFASRVLGEEIAIRCLCSLVCAAFETSQPVRAFVMLLRRLHGWLATHDGKAFVSQKEPCRWVELFDLILNDLEYEAAPDSSFGYRFTTPFFRLTIRNWVGGHFDEAGEVVHPVLTPLAKKWLAEETVRPGLRLLLPQLPWADSGDFPEVFQPPLTIARFSTPSGRNSVVLIGDVGDMAWPREGIADLMTVFSTVRRATESHYDPDHRLCAHAQCPQYDRNFCNSYPIIPAHFLDCGFESRVSRLILHARSLG